METSARKTDMFLWTSCTVLFIAALSQYYVLDQYSTLMRLIALLVLVGLSVFSFVNTTSGKQLKVLWGESLTEVRKVVWPTKQEMVQTTAIVLVMVLIMALLLWLLDAVLLHVLSFVTGF